MRIELVKGDITTQDVDALINAANSSLMGGGGVDGAIHRKGGPTILDECRKLRDSHYPKGLPEGQAIATTAGNLPAQWIIHTVGPVYSRHDDRTETLRACYRNSLTIADTLGATTLAVPLISSGIYGWPKDDAIRQAVDVLQTTPTSVTLARIMLFSSEEVSVATRLYPALVVSSLPGTEFGFSHGAGRLRRATPRLGATLGNNNGDDDRSGKHEDGCGDAEREE